MNCPQCKQPQTPRLVVVSWPVRLGLFAVALAAAYVLAGSAYHDRVEGLQRSLLPQWKLWLPGLLLLLAAAASVVRVKRLVCTECGAAAAAWFLAPLGRERSDTALAMGTSRRVALRMLGAAGAVVAAGAAGVAAVVGRNRGWVPVAREFFFTTVETTAPVARPEWAGARIASHRRLGRTNAMVSDISLGSGRINDAEIARRALDRGVNYFDTAPDYAEFGSERVLGEAMKGRRDQVFLATKFCVADGHLPNDTPVPKIIEAVDGSLRRLQTDYVDLVHIHACDRLDRLMAPNIHEAFDRLKEQGKARFLGVSSHTPNLEEVANAAIDSGRFDVMMLAYHFGMWSSLGHILGKARAHDVGIVAMKTLKGARHTDLAEFRDQASAYSQAAFRWVLSNPSVSCLVVSFFKMEQVDEYLFASGQPMRDSDVALLDRYDRLIAGDYCQPHCGTCLDACPYQLPINDILRHRMYVKDYRWEHEGLQQYAKLDRNAAACRSCAAPCANTCPISVPIRAAMLEAHRLLT